MNLSIPNPMSLLFHPGTQTIILDIFRTKMKNFSGMYGTLEGEVFKPFEDLRLGIFLRHDESALKTGLVFNATEKYMLGLVRGTHPLEIPVTESLWEEILSREGLWGVRSTVDKTKVIMEV